MVYMISNYLKGQKGDEVAGGEEGQPTELVQAGADSVCLLYTSPSPRD